MKIYMIPGLGFDQRMFQKLDLKEFDVEYINWIEPGEGESFHDYAIRLLRDIDDSQDVVLIGHSLGGLIAQEVARVKRIKKIILISSIKSRKEMPFHFKIVQPLRIYKLFTKALCLNTVSFWGKNHDYESPEEQALFKSMVGNQSNTYLQWALRSLSIWNPAPPPAHTAVFQIHGTNDQTFPFRLIKSPDIEIPDAGHFMIYKEKHGIGECILKELRSS